MVKCGRNRIWRLRVGKPQLAAIVFVRRTGVKSSNGSKIEKEEK